MAVIQQVECDLCGEPVVKKERVRFALRNDDHRPESAEYLDIGPCCHSRSIGELVKLADSRRPEDASGYKA